MKRFFSLSDVVFLSSAIRDRTTIEFQARVASKRGRQWPPGTQGEISFAIFPVFPVARAIPYEEEQDFWIGDHVVWLNTKALKSRKLAFASKPLWTLTAANPTSTVTPLASSRSTCLR